MKSDRPYFHLNAQALLVLLLLAGLFPGGRLMLLAQTVSHPGLKEAEAALHAMQWTEARDRYEEAIGDPQMRAEARVGVARVYMGQKRWAEALLEVDKAFEEAPENKHARYFKAVIHRETAKFDVLQAPKHRERAISLLEELIQEDSTFGLSLYELAVLHGYLEEFETALTLAHRQMKIASEDPWLQIGIHRLYRHFLAFAEEEQVTDWLENRAPDGFKQFFTAERDRAGNRVNFAAGRLEMLLDNDSLHFPVEPLLLSRARLFYADRQGEAAQALINEAIDGLESEIGAAFLFEDFKYVLTDAELLQYLQLQSLEETKAFFRAIWTERNPMPARKENLRLTEHYRRLLIAEKEYQFYGIRSWHNNPDQAGHLAFPMVTQLNQEYNDKGLIFIRHGEPIDKITHVGGQDNFFRTQVTGLESASWLPSERTYNRGYALNESWRYNDPAMDFHFVVATNEANNWRLIPFLTSFDMLESREIWGDPYASMVRVLRDQQRMGQEGTSENLSSGFLEDFSEEFDSLSASGSRLATQRNVAQQAIRFDLEMEEVRQMMIQHSQESVELGLTTDKQTWGEEVEPMPIPYMLAAFRGPEGRTELDLYYALPIGKISEFWEGAGNRIPVETGYAILANDWSVVAQELDTKRLPRSTDPTDAVVDFHRAVVLPDSYQVALHGLPEDASLLGGYRFGYRVPDYTGNELMMSDLLLAHNINPITIGESRFDRNGYKILSNPFQRYQTNQIVYVYFEAYNLTFSSDDLTDYEIEYIINPEQERRGLFRRRSKSLLSLKVDRSGDTAAPVEYAEFDVSDVDPGKYALVIRVTDKVTGAVVEKSRDFELVQ